MTYQAVVQDHTGEGHRRLVEGERTSRYGRGYSRHTGGPTGYSHSGQGTSGADEIDQIPHLQEFSVRVMMWSECFLAHL